MIPVYGWLPGWWLPVAIAWPLLLALGHGFHRVRPITTMLGPLASLPALAAVLLVDTGWSFFGWTYTGLSLDDTGRAFLLLASVLWLAAGHYTIAAPRGGKDALRTVLALIAMSGLFGAALAEDAVVLIAASTQAGYALAGLLACGVHPAAVGRTRVLVGALVIGDLLLLEALLMLAHDAADIELASLRAAFAENEDRGLILAFLLAGLGAKAAIAGAHVWLPPQLPIAGAGERLAVLAFLFGVGLLGWLRLLPLGDVAWPAAARILSWGAWLIPAWALLAGTMQTRSAGVLAYAMVAVSGLWLAAFGAVLEDPHAHAGVAGDLIHAVLRIAPATAALWLVEPGFGAGSGMRRLPALALAAASGLALALSAGILATKSGMSGAPSPVVYYWNGTALLLLVLVALARARGVRQDRPSVRIESHPRTDSGAAWLPATVFAAIALLSLSAEMPMQPSRVLIPAVVMLTGAMLASMLGERLVPARLPRVGARDAPSPMRRMLAALRARERQLMEVDAGTWSANLLRHGRRLAGEPGWARSLARIQSLLNRWSMAALLAVAVGLLSAWLGAST